MNKFVAMAEKQCPVCLITHSNGAEILLHRQLKDIPEDNRCTGFHLCSKCEELKKSGYVAVIPIDAPESMERCTIANTHKYRTGGYGHVAKKVIGDLLNIPEEDAETDLIFVDTGVWEHINDVYEKSANNTEQ